jgi:mRNA interferase HicA
MKRYKLLKHLKGFNCLLHRERGRHSLFKNSINAKMTTIPRHPDIKENLCRKICKDLGVVDVLK